MGSFTERRVGAAEAIAVAQGVSQDVQAAEIFVVGVVLTGDEGVEGMVDVVKPLRVKAVSTVLIGTDDARIIQVRLSDDDGVRLIRDPVDVFHDGKRSAVIIRMHRIKAQTIHVEFFEPLAYSIEDVGANLIRIRPGKIHHIAPTSRAHGRVRAEKTVVVTVGAKVVVHHVEIDGDVVGMRGVDKLLQLVRPTVTLVDSEPIHTVITPIPLPSERLHGHELDGGHAKISEVRKLFDDPRKRPLRRKSTHVELIDHLALEFLGGPGLISPREICVEDFR